MKIYVAHSNDFDYENKLYKPLRTSQLNVDHEIFLPHEEGSQLNTRELMKTYDLLVAEVSMPSTGEGIEMGRAEANNVPILCIYEQGANISNSLKYVTEQFIEYSDVEDMLMKLQEFLTDSNRMKSSNMIP